ncbi:MAG: right-handed parallel beta-helix repeat-containing protein [Candidatus Thorarchaeota archaeon]
MMNKKSKYKQIVTGFLCFLLLGTSVVMFAQQIPATRMTIAEVSMECLVPQDSFATSYAVHDPIVITSNGDFVSQGFPGSGASGNPYMIEGYNITTAGDCVSIQDTDAYFVIRNCLLTGGMSLGNDGVELDRVDHGEIRNNTIFGNNNGVNILSSSYITVVNNTIIENSLMGVGLSSSPNNIVVNNTLSESHYGVIIHDSSNTTLSSNIFVNNGFRISGGGLKYWQHTITFDNVVNGKLLGYFWNLTGGTIDGTQYGQVILANCTGVTVENGEFSDVSVGIEFGYSSNCSLVNCSISENYYYGLHLFVSFNNTITNNTISENHYLGMWLWASSNNTVVNNTISLNDIGVHLTQSSYNLLYLNTIAYNDVENAKDDGTYNHWNTTGIGNSWSDYSGIGEYNVSGYAGSIDYYPFIFPSDETPPIINHPSDINYEEGTTGNTITWTLSDAYPSHYVVYLNDTDIVLAGWHGISILVNVDGLGVNVHNYTIKVYDTSGNWVLDTVIVTVLPQASTTTTTTTTDTTTTGGVDISMALVFIGVGVIGAVIVVIIFLKFRKGI